MMTCPKCGDKFDGRAYKRHVAACKGNTATVIIVPPQEKDALARYKELLAKVEEARKDLVAEKTKLEASAQEISFLLQGSATSLT